MFKLSLPEKKLFSIALDIGKDVPFFMLEEPCAIAKGTGELLEKVNLAKDLFHILIKPPISLSTRMMYERIDRRRNVRRPRSLKGALKALKDMDVKALERNYYNIFESVLARSSVYISAAKSLLADKGAGRSLLSGSGPTVFCTFDNREDAEAVFRRLPKNTNPVVFLAKTCK